MARKGDAKGSENRNENRNENSTYQKLLNNRFLDPRCGVVPTWHLILCNQSLASSRVRSS